MKSKISWKQRLCLGGVGLLCLGSVALASEIGGEDDPLLSLSYLNQSAIPALLQQAREESDRRAEELTAEFQALLETGEGSAPSSDQVAAVTYQVVTLMEGQTLHLSQGSEILLRIGSSVAYGQEPPALLDLTDGTPLSSGDALQTNHLYLATIPDHWVAATSPVVKVLVRGDYTLS